MFDKVCGRAGVCVVCVCDLFACVVYICICACARVCVYVRENMYVRHCACMRVCVCVCFFGVCVCVHGLPDRRRNKTRVGTDNLKRQADGQTNITDRALNS